MNALPKLPNRRLCITRVLHWRGADWLLGVGFDVEGRVREAFVQGPKSGSDYRVLLDDACVLVSKLLTLGVGPAEISGWMGKDGDGPASPIGAVAHHLSITQDECGPVAADAYRYAGLVPS